MYDSGVGARVTVYVLILEMQFLIALASPSSNKHTTSNSHQMPDKTSKDHQETLKSKQYSGLFAAAHAQIATSL